VAARAGRSLFVCPPRAAARWAAVGPSRLRARGAARARREGEVAARHHPPLSAPRSSHHDRAMTASPRRDAIVVGAGPAGAATAILLAREGLSGTVIDRVRSPRTRICGGDLSPQGPRLLDPLRAPPRPPPAPAPPPP